MPLFSKLFSRVARHRRRNVVRPWALLAPILVLVIALPLLRPLRYPAGWQVSDEEAARLATVQAVVEHGTLSIDGTDFTTTARKIEVNGHWYSKQPPTMSVLLAGPYWIMHHYGLSLHGDPQKVAYLLTLLGATIPAACAAGLIYRMGRLFELPRPWRALLAASAVLGTGLISYATVLSAHVPAAALVLASAGCLIHVTLAKRRIVRPVWIGLAGLCAALAAAIDPGALPFLVLFVIVAFVLGRNTARRLGNVLAYVAGFTIPLWLHAALTVPVTGNIAQGMDLHPQAIDVQEIAPDGAALKRLWRLAPWTHLTSAGANPADEEDEQPQGLWMSLGRGLGRISILLIGQHGLLSHFPVLLLGAAGVGIVMRRHWPRPAKLLAGATLVGAVFLLLVYAAHRDGADGWRDAMFASRWLILFGPLLLFWAGAWVRRAHRPVTWATAGALLLFSVSVSVIGAVAGPMPHDGFVTPDGRDRYTAAGAVSNLLHPTDPLTTRPILAHR